MKARAITPPAMVLLPVILITVLAFSAFLAKAAPTEAQKSWQPGANNPTPIASNYCLSCHTPGDSRLDDPTAWQGGIAAASNSPCPAMKTIQEELYYTERLLLAIDRYRSDLPGYVDASSLDGRLAAGQQGYLRLLDAPVTSLDAFTAEAQSVRYKLGKVYSGIQALDEAAKRRRALVAGIVVSLVLLGSLVWGLYNTRHVRKAQPVRSRTAILGVAVFLILVFVFFALPLLRVPAEEVVTDAEAQALQTTLDTAQRAATAGDRSQARAWILGKVAAMWAPIDPDRAEAILAEAQAASKQQRANALALWGEAASAQEAATGDLAKLETAGLISNELNATRARTWDLRLIAQEWQPIDPGRADQILEGALEASAQAQGIYRDLDRRGIAAAFAGSDLQRALEIAGQIQDPELRAWALREIRGDSAEPQATAGDPAAPEAQTLALLRSGLAGDRTIWPAAWEASLAIPDVFERGRAQVEIARGWAESEPDQALMVAQQIEIPLLRDRALRFVILKTGDASLFSQIENPYDQVMALTALGRYSEAEALVGDLKETYPVVKLVQALAKVDLQKALTLVDGLQREADKAEALRTLAVLSRDPALFERALGMALAARVRNDPLAPVQASLDLADAFLMIDPALAQQALAQAYEIAQRISVK